MISSFVKEALNEDLGRGDLFEHAFNSKIKASAQIIAKESGIFSGKIYAKELANQAKIKLDLHKNDSEPFQKDQILATLEGDFCQILKIERTILNILQHSSGIATNTNNFIKHLGNQKIKILDTRKTRPLLRKFEKYSVLNGGAMNHRLGLDDCLMLKDTHLAKISDLGGFIKVARAKIPWTCKIEVECQSIEDTIKAMEAHADIVMCDNMPLDLIEKVVTFRNKNFPHILLEVSGNISISNISNYANLGIDAISSGALIHSAKFIDLSIKIE